MKKITFVDGCDWQGIYLGDKLAIQNHSLHAIDVLEALGLKLDYVESSIVDDFLCNHGQLPDKLKELK